MTEFRCPYAASEPDPKNFVVNGRRCGLIKGVCWLYEEQEERGNRSEYPL